MTLISSPKSRNRILLISLCLLLLFVFIVSLVKQQVFNQGDETSKSSDYTLIKNGERLEREVVVDGIKRSFTVFFPRIVSGDGEEAPILFAFHPGGATAKFMEERAPFHLATGTESMVVVYPEGYGRSFNAGECCGKALEEKIDDVAFFKSMMEDIDKILSIRDRAYVTGFSNGAMMTYRLMCDAPQLIAAAAPYASSIVMDNCISGFPIPTMYINGGADTLTLTGGEGVENPMFPNATQALVVPYEALDAIAARNGCDLSRIPAPDLPTMDASCEAYAGCPIGAPVSMCVISGLGHAWPGSGDDVSSSGLMGKLGQRMGPYRPELDSTGPIVEFFARY